MKTGHKISTALLGIVIGSLPLSANAGFISFSEDFESPTTDIAYVGNATQTTFGLRGVSRLTSNVQSQTGAVWNTQAYRNVRGFTASFDFLIGPSDGGGADGLTFSVIDADAYDPNTAIGGGGGGLGYLGLGNSFAVEFDTWNNGASIDNNNSNHVGINQNGDIASLALAGLPFSLETTNASNWLTALITLDDSGLLTVGIGGTTYLSHTLSGYSRNMYFGFTAATGGAVDQHYIDNWDMRIQVPEPGTLALLGIGLVGLGMAGRRRKV